MQISLIKKIVLITLLSAFLKNIQSSFNSKSVSELSFYISYIVLIFTIIGSFSVNVLIVEDVINTMLTTLEVLMPAIATILISGGYMGEVTLMGPIVIGSARLIIFAISNIFLPLTTFITTLSLINFISEKTILNNFVDFFKNIISWGLKTTAAMFMFIISLQRIGTPAINKLFGRGAKVFVGAVPIVGDVLNGAIEIASSFSGAIKNGLSVAFIIVFILIALLPIIKLLVIIIIYKLTASLLEPIAETRLIKCLNNVADFTLILLSIVVTVEIVFIFCIIVLLTTIQ